MRLIQKRVIWLLAIAFATSTIASSGDRLPEFRDCLAACHYANCQQQDLTPIPLHRRLLLWSCPAECDHVCQHIVTVRHQTHSLNVHQYHGKWPFHRFLGLQEPFSILFSLFNLLAHVFGLSYLRTHIPSTYPFRRYYEWFAYVGVLAWTASIVFHARDFILTERLDYFAAGGNVLYGLYYAPIRIFRLDGSVSSPQARKGGASTPPPANSSSTKTNILRAWTLLCAALYAAHVAYLTLYKWDYGYNMLANICVGMLQNVLWVSFAYYSYSKAGRGWDNFWRLWPAFIVGWVVLAMSFEILDFVPIGLMVDAHSLWHLGTVVPGFWWYLFLVRDAKDDMGKARLKA